MARRLQRAEKATQRSKLDVAAEKKLREEAQAELEERRHTRLQLINENLLADNERLRRLLAEKEEEAAAQKLTLDTAREGLKAQFGIELDDGALLAESRRCVAVEGRQKRAVVRRAQPGAVGGGTHSGGGGGGGGSSSGVVLGALCDCLPMLQPLGAAGGLLAPRSGPPIPEDAELVALPTAELLALGSIEAGEHADRGALLAALRAERDERNALLRAEALPTAELTVREIKAWLRAHGVGSHEIRERGCVEKADLCRLLEETRYQREEGAGGGEGGPGGGNPACAIQ